MQKINFYVDLLEVYNGRGSWRETQFAKKAAVFLGKKGIGGSDAHSVLSVGSCVTVFDYPVESEVHMLAQLHKGTFYAEKRQGLDEP